MHQLMHIISIPCTATPGTSGVETESRGVHDPQPKGRVCMAVTRSVHGCHQECARLSPGVCTDLTTTGLQKEQEYCRATDGNPERFI
ncbi:unnamed protein product [Gadus morhua 'NCC']